MSSDKPRVLLLGGRNAAQSLRSVLHGFERIGCAVHYLATRRKGTKCDPLKHVEAVLTALATKFKPDVLYWYMCKWDCPVGLISALKEARPEMVTVFHSFDDPYQIESPDGPPPCIPEFDAAVTCCQGSVPWYEERGLAVAVAYPPPDDTLHAQAKPGARGVDFSFVATNVYPKPFFPAVLANRADLVRVATQLGSVKLYGFWGDHKYDWGSKYGVPEMKRAFAGFAEYGEQPGIYASTAININSHVRPDGYRYLNERTLAVMGSGGFLLCDRVNGIEEMFEPGKHLDTWGDINEFRVKAAYWLAHPDERQAVAARAKALVWQKYGNVQHAETVLHLAQEVK